jgi:two-component sensor histidine kinase
MTRTTNFGGYLEAFCQNLAEIQAVPGGGIFLTCDSDGLVLDLVVVTALGIVVTEVVINSYLRACVSGRQGSGDCSRP